MREMPGVVRMGMIYRLPSLTPEEFSRHWSGPHGQFATRIPNLRRYHQHHALSRLPFGSLPDRWKLDGLSQLWFDDVDAMMSGIRSPDYSGLAQDTPTVMTMPGLIVGRQAFLVGEKPDEAVHIKAMVVLGRRDGVDAVEFVRSWRDRIASLSDIAGLDAAALIDIGHRESEPGILVDYDRLPVDLVLEFWFDTEVHLDQAFASDLPRKLGLDGDDTTAYASGFKARTHLIVD